VYVWTLTIYSFSAKTNLVVCYKSFCFLASLLWPHQTTVQIEDASMSFVHVYSILWWRDNPNISDDMQWLHITPFKTKSVENHAPIIECWGGIVHWNYMAQLNTHNTVYEILWKCIFISQLWVWASNSYSGMCRPQKDTTMHHFNKVLTTA